MFFLLLSLIVDGGMAVAFSVLHMMKHPVHLKFFSFSYRDLGEHGFLVEGCLPTFKTQTESVSIPYKYVVYKKKKGKYDYEFIYKPDSKDHTNRCLFVKPHLLSHDGNLIFKL